MKIAFNPSTVAALTTPPNNKDITFDLRGRNIFARGVKFCGTDTNTWRDIKINNVSIGSNTLDLRNGSNTTLTNTNGVVTINSTWRPVVDNLTSDSTTSSLSAKQGKVLKSLIDGKSNSGHTHDDRYLKLTGGTMASNALITFADSGSWGTDKGPQGARGGLYWTGQSDYAKLYAEETVGDNLDLVIQFGDDNSNGLSIRNKANTQTSYISAGGVITTGTFKGNLDWSYITNKPSSYTPSTHTHAWNSLTHSSTTENQAILTNGKANGWKLYTLNISRWDNAANNAHSHSNKSVLDGITSGLVNNWNIAYTFVNTITGTDTDKVINKWDEIVNFLAGITEDNKLNTLLNSKLSVYKLADNTNVGAIKNNGIYYSTSDASSGTLVNSPFNTGFALINMTSLDNGDDLRRSRLAFNAYGEIKVSDDRDLTNTAETWYNVLTSKNSGISGSTIKLNGASITVYSSSTADGRYVKKSGDTMTGALNFANNTWNKVGDDSYVGDCNVSGHFGIKAANTTYPGIAFFNNSGAHLGNLTAYNGNIKYGAYSLRFLDNGNTSVGASTWTNPFSGYNSNAVADGQAICVWGQSSSLSNLAADSGDMSLWLKRVNAKAATLNMVLDGEYYANGNLRLAHVSEIPTALKNPYALTISLNGTSQGPYDGSAAKNINITPSSIGAATSGHNHDGRYVYNYGGTAANGLTLNQNALFMSTTSGITGDWWHILQAAWNGEYRWNSLIAFPTLNRNGMYYRSGLDDNTKWGSWVKLLDANNYSSTLDSRYYTKSEVNTKLGTYLSLSGGTVTGNIILKGGTSADMTYAGNVHPYIRFDNSDSSLNVSLIFTDYDAYRRPAGIKLVGNQGNEWFEAANMYATTFYGALSGNASSANKLTTARNIALGTDLRGSANFDGSSNITISANINACTVGVGSTNGLPFKRIAHFETGSSWNDNALLLYISLGYINGSNGICRVEFRTDNISSSSTSVTASAAVKWLVRNGYGLDSLYAGYYVTTSKAYIDIYLKTTGGYQGTVIRVLLDSRGGINSNVLLINSYYYSDTNHKEAYNSIEAASTALYNRAYTRIVSGSDVGTVSYSNSTGSVHWNNVTNKPSTFAPAAHTHTVFKNNLMIKGTNGVSDSASIHLGIGDSDTGFKWISDGKCLIYANNSAVGEWTSGGMNWFKNPTVNGNKVWNAGNDGSGSGLDADTVDGIDSTGFLRYYNSNSAPSNVDIVNTPSYVWTVSTTGGSVANATKPSGVDNAWGVIHLHTHIGNYATQLGFGGTTSRMYMRNAYNTSTFGNWQALAFTTDNVASATKLQTTRTLWGQPFNGTANVDNTLRIRQTTGNYCEGIRIQNGDNTWATIILGATGDSGTNANAWSIHRKSDNNFAISRNSSDGTNGLVMTSVGMGLGTTAPTQRLDVRGNTTITGFIAASSAFINTGDSTLKVYSGRITDAKSDGNICLQTSIDGTDGQSHAYPTQYGARCNLVLLPRGGQVYIGTNPDGGNTTYKLYVNSKIFSNGGFVKNGSSDSYVLLGGGGHKAISDFATSSHTHGLLHSNLTVNLANTTTDSGWSMINSSYNGFLLKSIRTLGSAPNWIENNYAAGICFGGADTKGVVSVAYGIPYIKFAGGNGSKPVWWIRLSGISGTTYNLANFNADTLDGVHLNGIFTAFLANGNATRLVIGGVTKDLTIPYASKAGSVAWDSITGKPSSFTPSSHTHSWTSITDKLVAGNEFNIVNAGFKEGMWFNYLPINDRSKTATITGYHFGNGATGYTSINASGFIKKGSNSNYVLLGDGGHKLESALRVAYASNADMVDGYHATDGRTFTGNINWSNNWNDAWSDGTNKHPWYGFDHRYPNTGAYSTTISDFFGMTIKTANTLRLDFGTLLLNGTSIYSINVASATKLQTARTIWGQSFDGTANVNGTIYINNSDSSNGAIRLNNNVNSNARISAISDQVIFNTGNAIRFGETTWDWNVWAGLKYTHSNKTIYLGIADNSIFNANSALSGGSLRFPGISNVYATTFNGSLSGNASTATNADKIDGVHLNGIFTAFGNNAHNITATIGGVTKSFLVNWAADSDKLDGYHENSFLRYRGDTSTDLEATLWSLIGIKLYNNALPDNLTGVYNYGSVISLPGSSSRFEIYASHLSSNGNGLYYRSGWSSDKKTWLKFIDSSNIGSQSVNYANSAGNADKLDGIHANGLLTALSNTNNGISITVGGTTKSVSNISVNYASSAGSATKVIVNLHTTNDTNYPLVWSNLNNSNTVTENQLYKSWSDLYYNPKNKRLTVGGSVVASSFVKRGGNSLQLLRADGGIATFNWSGQSGLPSWLWGGNNEHSYYVYNPSNFRVAYATSAGSADTALYLRSLGNLNCQTGRTLNYGDVYTYNTYDGNTGSPTTFTSVIGFGRGIAGTVEIAGGWDNTNLYWRSLRDCCEDWHSWRTVLDSSNYTEFINNYYWANVKISASSSTTTSPIVLNLTALSSIKMGNIYLLNTDEINNSANGSIYLNYRNSGNVSLCLGGGSVGIGTTTPSYKLDVNGLMRASGFHHSSINSDNYILLAGGGYSQGVPVKYWSIESISIYGPTEINRTNRGGNYTFVTKVEPRIKGSCTLTLQFPSGYNDKNTIIWARGVLNFDTSDDSTIYATILQFSGSKYYLNLSDDNSLNNGACQLYFMCF